MKVIVTGHKFSLYHLGLKSLPHYVLDTVLHHLLFSQSVCGFIPVP